MENILDLIQSHLDHLDIRYVKSQIIKKEKDLMEHLIKIIKIINRGKEKV